MIVHTYIKYRYASLDDLYHKRKAITWDEYVNLTEEVYQEGVMLDTLKRIRETLNMKQLTELR